MVQRHHWQDPYPYALEKDFIQMAHVSYSNLIYGKKIVQNFS